MADAMGSETLVGKADEAQKEHYRIVTFNSKDCPEDFKPKIIANFLNSLRYGNDYFKLIDKDNYFPNYTKYVNLLLSKPTTFVRFALLSDETIIGWSIFEGPLLHYVFVNKDVRRNGISKALLPTNVKSFTHITNKAIGIWLKHYPEARFNPLG